MITGKREYKEESKVEKKEKEEFPVHTEKMHVYKSIKLPLEVKPEGVKAILKNGILEVTLPKAEVVKKVKIEVKAF